MMTLSWTQKLSKRVHVTNVHFSGVFSLYMQCAEISLCAELAMWVVKENETRTAILP